MTAHTLETHPLLEPILLGANSGAGVGNVVDRLRHLANRIAGRNRHDVAVHDAAPLHRRVRRARHVTVGAVGKRMDGADDRGVGYLQVVQTQADGLPDIRTDLQINAAGADSVASGVGYAVAAAEQVETVELGRRRAPRGDPQDLVLQLSELRLDVGLVGGGFAAVLRFNSQLVHTGEHIAHLLQPGVRGLQQGDAVLDVGASHRGAARLRTHALADANTGRIVRHGFGAAGQTTHRILHRVRVLRVVAEDVECSRVVVYYERHYTNLRVS